MQSVPPPAVGGKTSIPSLGGELPRAALRRGFCGEPRGIVMFFSFRIVSSASRRTFFGVRDQVAALLDASADHDGLRILRATDRAGPASTEGAVILVHPGRMTEERFGRVAQNESIDAGSMQSRTGPATPVAVGEGADRGRFRDAGPATAHAGFGSGQRAVDEARGGCRRRGARFSILPVEMFTRAVDCPKVFGSMSSLPFQLRILLHSNACCGQNFPSPIVHSASRRGHRDL